MTDNLLLSKNLDSNVLTSLHLSAAVGNTFLPFSLLSGRAKEYGYAMRDNWDAQGARALSWSVIRLAERLIKQFGRLDYLVEIAPGRDGSISFIWDDERGNYIYLDVGPSDTTHLYYEAVGEAKWEGVSIANDPRITARLQHAFAQLYPTQQTVFRLAAASGSHSRNAYVRIA